MRQIGTFVLLTLLLSPVFGQQPQAKVQPGGAARSPENVAAQLDVEYARIGDVSLKLDVYQAKTEIAALRPCIIWIHGGGWRSGSKSTGAQRLAPLVATGDYVGVSVDYRLLGVAIWPAQIHDCKAAIRYVRANSNKLGVDPNRIGVWGASAGGHLVSLLGTSGEVKELEGDVGIVSVSSRVACVVDFCGPSDFFLAGIGAPRASEQIISTLFGGPLKDKENVVRQASPVTHVTNDDPPFLIMHGTNDNTVNILQAERLYEAQKQAGVDTTFVKVEGGRHGFGGLEVNARVKAFLDKHMLGKDVVVSDDPIQATLGDSKTE